MKLFEILESVMKLGGLPTATVVIQVKDDSTIHFVKVKQGRDLGDKIEILEGLKGDELLITNIKDDLKEGQKVKYQK